VVLTNTVGIDPDLRVWTDFWIQPNLGDVAENPATNTSSLYWYFNSDGAVVMETASGWQTCTNDIWGHSVPPATNNAYVHIAVFRNYSASNQAVFLNDQLIVQDMEFRVPATSSKNVFLIQSTNSNCWLDNVWVQTISIRPP